MAHGCPYFDIDYVPLSEYIPPLGVSVDNDTCDDFNIIKVHGANRYGILLKIIQAMSDLDLIISKSYISSDGSWFMNSFHVTDPQGHKIKDFNLIQYMQDSLNLVQKEKGSCSTTQVKIRNGNIVTVNHFGSDCATLEITFFDRPGIFSEICTLLFEHSYFVDSGDLWTYNGIAACVLYIKEQDNVGRHIMDEDRLDYLGEYVASILDARHSPGELFTVEIKNPPDRQIHTERRLHQMMNKYMDYDVKTLSLSIKSDQSTLATTKEAKRNFGGVAEGNVERLPQVLIENWQYRDYLVLNVSRDRPKLIFDIVCTLTDLNYDIFHGSICSEDDVIVQNQSSRRTPIVV
ncbi:ACT domain-containing protein ACR3-like [Phalaenopsis equestris]|uniref:ACT domain-containing protein ACR3-like n=1 Tax=Phalaenopsis equestris TaxID=78828 RepID=UPI0009E18F96|nr:ACT domain-containing protein ACR3-like [Phalaenopsis equestris]